MTPFSRILACALLIAPTQLLAEPTWPLVDSAKSPSKALNFPTKLDPVQKSLTDVLKSGGKVITSSLLDAGPVVTVVSGRIYMICLVKGTNPATDQNVATSECYALN